MFEKNVNIIGKHALYINDLKKNNFFERFLDVYINAAFIGFKYNRRVKPDNMDEGKFEKATIMAEQMISEGSTLEFIYRVIMLLENEENLSLEERVTRAFRDDSLDKVSERHEENMKVFNEYVLGGIEVLHEKLVKYAATKEDYMKNAYNFVREMNTEMISEVPEDLIDEI